jgi:Mannosyltransferase (PIG-V)
VFGWWLASRLVTIAAFLALDLRGPAGYFGAQLYRSPLTLFGTWDGVWYRRVAAHGYLLVPGRQSDPAFFPVYPILLRGLHDAGLRYVVAGVLLSNACFLLASVAFFELGRRVVDEDTARRAACLLAVTPMAFVFSMTYPESLALLLIVLALLAALENLWAPAAVLMALGGLTRPETAIFAVPLAALAWSRRDALGPASRGQAVAAVVAAPIAVATFPLYLEWAIGDAGAWGRAQRGWGRSFSPLGPIRLVEHLPAQLGQQPWLVRDLVLLGCYTALLVVAARRGVGLPWVAAGALVLALPLFSGSAESEGRFGLLALPIYWGLAALTRRRGIELAAGGAMLVVLAAGVLTLPYIWP